MSNLLTVVSLWEKSKTPQEMSRLLYEHRTFFGRRIYLAIDSLGNCSIRSLNFFQRLVRKLLGCYRETHKKILLGRMQKLEKVQIQNKMVLKILTCFEERLKASLFKISRRTPPLAICDTIIFKDGKIAGAHNRGVKPHFFQDHEIIQVHAVLRKQLLDGENPFPEADQWGVEWRPIYAEYSAHQKPIIQQAAMRGCTAAATAMLIMDHGKQCDVQGLRMRNLGQTRNMKHDIEKAGLKAVVSSCRSFDDLKELIRKHGSAIVSVSGEIGGHVIVVDAIGNDQARIRDPYHGWEITIKLDALKARFIGGNSVIQVERS